MTPAQWRVMALLGVLLLEEILINPVIQEWIQTKVNNINSALFSATQNNPSVKGTATENTGNALTSTPQQSATTTVRM